MLEKELQTSEPLSGWPPTVKTRLRRLSSRALQISERLGVAQSTSTNYRISSHLMDSYTQLLGQLETATTELEQLLAASG